MSFPLSRLMSAATAGYAVFALVKPSHLADAMGAPRSERSGYDLLARVFGVRDLAVSTAGLTASAEGSLRVAMGIRTACDVGDGLLLAARAPDGATRAKVLGVTLTWATLNAAAVTIDVRRPA